jgi:hypothetical protein
MYDAVQLKKRRNDQETVKIFAVGDFVHLRSSDRALPFIGRIANLWEKNDGLKMLTVQWCYRSRDVPAQCQASLGGMTNKDILLTDHFDHNEVGSILETVRIQFTAWTARGSRTVVSHIFTDGLDFNYGWGDALLQSEPQETQTNWDYCCSKKYSVAKNSLRRLNKEDLDQICEQLYSDETKMNVVPLTAERLTQLAMGTSQARQDQSEAEDGNVHFDALELRTVDSSIVKRTPQVRKGDTLLVHHSAMNPAENGASVQGTPTFPTQASLPKRLRLSSNRSEKSTDLREAGGAIEGKPQMSSWGCTVQ